MSEEKPYEVGDVVVFNPKHIMHVPAMQAAGEGIGDMVFDPDVVMVVTLIEPFRDSQSGWHVDTVIQGQEDAGKMTDWDSDWFVKRGDE